MYKYLLILTVFTAGCGSLHEMSILEGEWREDTGIQIMAGDFIKFSFKENKFVYSYEEFGDVPFKCDNNTEIYLTKDVGEGDFEIDNDIVILSGTWLESS